MLIPSSFAFCHLRLLLLSVLAVASFASITRAANPDFAAKTDFPTGINPRSVATADLNGDGKLDLASVNLNSNTASVLLNTTDPGAATPVFAAKKDFQTAAEPVSIAIVDVNGDGKPDLAVADFAANSVSVFLNTTAPGAPAVTFANKQDFAVAEGPIYLTVGDVNSDGILDLVTVNVLSFSVSVLVNTTAPGATTPSFGNHQEFATEDSPSAVALGDLNRDGKLDVAVVNLNSNTASLLLNTTPAGSPTVSFSGLQDVDTGDGPSAIALGDINGDGTLDLVISDFRTKSVGVLLNTTVAGAATATFSLVTEFGAGAGPISIALGDVNKDGRLDLTVANRNSDSISVLVNITAPGADTPEFDPHQDFATADTPVFISLNDLSGDGKLDLAAANLNANSVSVLLNTTDNGLATPTFTAKQDFPTGSNPRSATVSDFNLDGKLDIAVANVISDNVSVLLNTTEPGALIAGFGPKKDFMTGLTPESVTSADLNNDGKPDLAVANINSSELSVLLNTTTPGAAAASFAAKQDFATGDGPLFITAGDINGDGKVDLVVVNLVSSISVLFNTTVPGATTPSFAPKQDFVTGDGPRSISLADINRDGKLDLCIANFNSNSVTVLLNTTDVGGATPTFAPIRDFPVNVRPVSISSADLNNDGILDLAVVNVNSNNVSVLLNTTAAGAAVPSFTGKQDFDTGGIARSLVVDDLNGDGKLDLAVVKSTANDISVLLNSTTPGSLTSSFTDKQEFPAGNTAISVASGDLNGDGKPDLVTANFDADTVSVLLNTPAFIPTIGLSFTQGSTIIQSQIARVTNYGGDASIAVKVLSDDPANGVTISNITNSNGKILADFILDCDATNATFSLRVSDGSSTIIGTLNIAGGAPNTPPTLTYANQTVSLGGSLDINPTTGPFDNGSVSTVTVQSSGTFLGRIIPGDNGIVTIVDAAPAGIHHITIRATDNCGATTDTDLTVTVLKADQVITFAPLADKALGDPDFAVSATTSSGLAASFSATGQCTLNGATVHLTGTGLCTITASQAGNGDFNPAPDVQQTFSIAGNSVIALSQQTYEVNEDAGFVTITVNRAGDLSANASVKYATDDTGSSKVCGTLNTGLASSRCDFGVTLGTLEFNPAETQKTFIIPITQDSYAEGPETFTVSLSKVSGAGTNLGVPSSANVIIHDGVITLPPNPIDDTATFVRQQYHDFLNREADPAGLAFWTNEIDNCTPKPQCTDQRRINTSAAFFLSIEFQTTGNLVRNVYVAALDRPDTNNMPAFEEFERDTQAMQRGLIVDPNNNDWQIVLAHNTDAFLKDFVTRAEFVGLYPTGDTPAQYVDKLFLHAGVIPTAGERAAAIAEFGDAVTAADASPRGRALLDVTKNAAFQQREINRSFVQMQYFGYLRRNPNDTPDVDFTGFDFWLTKLNEFRGDFQAAEMVRAFISSDEYRRRFGL